MKDISQNDLEELQELMGRIQSEIENFSHVSEHLPKSITTSIEHFSNKLEREQIRRQDE